MPITHDTYTTRLMRLLDAKALSASQLQQVASAVWLIHDTEGKRHLVSEIDDCVDRIPSVCPRCTSDNVQLTNEEWKAYPPDSMGNPHIQALHRCLCRHCGKGFWV